MILHSLTETEEHPVYKEMAVSNGGRQYDFIRSAVQAGLGMKRDFLSTTVVKALNFHAIACLHVSAGEFRPCEVSVGNHTPPPHYQVQAYMDDFINQVNRRWETMDPIVLSARVLHQLNFIHPFINGNGRTARAAAYFVLCLKSKAWLPGKTILPELLVRERARYIVALEDADKRNLQPLCDLIGELLEEQLGEFMDGSPPQPA